MIQPFGGFSFGFADVSWANYYSSLPEDIRNEVERHADEIQSADDLKHFVDLLMKLR